ncbi:hypothetical protein, partial [Streptomyces sp. SID3343]|uniref:hypothetical protein n=1 Tax=Streptomyces sp. SID3343 TaxID=2690260 RepID=UPI00136AB7C0
YAAGDPINRADPTGTWSLKSVASKATKKLGSAGNIATGWQFGEQLVQGDLRGAAGVSVGFLAGTVTTSVCTSITGGAGAVPCAVTGTWAGDQATEAFDKYTS